MIKFLFPLLIFFGCSNVNNNNENNNYKLLRGINLYSQGKRLEALEEYKKVLKTDSKNITLLNEIGVIESQLKNYEEAKKRFLKILKIDKRDRNALSNLGNISFIQGRYTDVISYMEKVPKERRTSQENTLLAYSYYRSKKYKESLLVLRELDSNELYTNPLVGTVYLNILIENRNKNLLFKEIEKIEEMKEKTPELVILISKAYIDDLQDYQSGERVLKSYLNSNGLNDEVLLVLAKLYYKIGKKKECLKVFSMISEDYRYNLEYIKVKRYVNY